VAAKGTKGKKTSRRNLTAFLCADVVGYSRLVSDNPQETLHTLTESRRVFSDKIEKFGDRDVRASA